MVECNGVSLEVATEEATYSIKNKIVVSAKDNRIKNAFFLIFHPTLRSASAIEEIEDLEDKQQRC